MKILQWSALTKQQKAACLERPIVSQPGDLLNATRIIINEVKTQGDAALKKFNMDFDGFEGNDFKVPVDSIKNANDYILPNEKDAIETAYRNIYAFHKAQTQKRIRIQTFPGIVCEKISRPIQAVGLYVPGGSAPLISTMLMLGIPSQIAKNPRRIVCTPPTKSGNISPHMLYAAALCGIDSIYMLGGAQAIAAMAYGTNFVPKVDKLFGPGNNWVTMAKQIVAQDPAGASIDMPAGPSEVMVIADEQAKPKFIAADLLSQAEHGPDSQVMLVCLSQQMAELVLDQVKQLLPRISRDKTAMDALTNSKVIIVDTLGQAIEIANEYAAEHLIIQTREARSLLNKITRAGSIFLGDWTPESVGDYASGTNHVLPTYGYARSVSGLCLNDFMLEMSVQQLSPSSLQAIAPTVETLAQLEGLDAHQLAITVRTEGQENDR
jgi:histidinol dehydrogenase